MTRHRYITGIALAALIGLAPALAACSTPAPTPSATVSVPAPAAAPASSGPSADEQAYLVKTQALMVEDSGPSAQLNRADYPAALAMGHAVCDAKATDGETGAMAVPVTQRSLVPFTYTTRDLVDMQAAAEMVLCP